MAGNRRAGQNRKPARREAAVRAPFSLQRFSVIQLSMGRKATDGTPQNVFSKGVKRQKQATKTAKTTTISCKQAFKTWLQARQKVSFYTPKGGLLQYGQQPETPTATGLRRNTHGNRQLRLMPRHAPFRSLDTLKPGTGGIHKALSAKGFENLPPRMRLRPMRKNRPRCPYGVK